MIKLHIIAGLKRSINSNFFMVPKLAFLNFKGSICEASSIALAKPQISAGVGGNGSWRKMNAIHNYISAKTVASIYYIDINFEFKRGIA